ncbi:uncharacterized protein EKO05_0006037 [Ascochyta rabiei]|uniref:Uncharacterized protein n=1 Tax=Didymella rabiei TaxID=5454 RepID=A0A163IER3_DIDRA|nr:uncharacterized protein EKO05_0006037 [Ascochyta rabiei]KZM25729.1 hypothetical protein ST47_g3107 [Ascochyta rabiei]UPX15593.1 hypothetical protein EKO05_0006037 [Ascochyta rabiei]
MASYFDIPSGSDAPAAGQVPNEERGEQQGISLLSPQVSRILDDLHLDERSSSSDGDEEDNSSASTNEEESGPMNDSTKIDDSFTRKSRQGLLSTGSAAHDSKTEAKPAPKHVRVTPGTATGDKSLKGPRSHMTRFQSLRSTLFQAHIEDNMKKCHQEAQSREEAATNWKAQHEKRQCYNRPHTPETTPHEKEGFTRRMGMKIRRLTSKGPPTMASIEENTGTLMRRESTATDDEDEPHGQPWNPRQSYESSINHSDVDELVRWVSRRDPPSDGERKASNIKSSRMEDSGHESLGHSDIDELVRHASRKSISTEPVVVMHTGYSDESTASDSEQSQEDDEQEEDSLSRWVSRRDGANAGPIRQQLSALQHEQDTENEFDVPEIGQWRTHHDDTSGESVAGSEIAKKDDVSVLEAKRGRSRERSPNFEGKGHLHNDDVDDLVRWMSRRDSKQQSNPDMDNETVEIKRRENEKKQQVGINIDDRSLAPEDIDDLLAHVRERQMTHLNSSITPIHI